MSLRKSSFYLTVGALLRLAFSLASVPLLIRSLGLERYGIWVVLTSIPTLGRLFEFGLTTAISKHISEENAREDWAAIGQNLTTSFLIMMLLGLAVSTGLLISTPRLSSLLFHGTPYLKEAHISLGIMTNLLFFYFWQDWLIAVQGGVMQHDLQVMTDIIGSLATTLGLLTIATINQSLPLLAGWLVLISICSLIARGMFLRHLLSQCKTHCRFSWSAARGLIHFGGVQWFSDLGSSLFGYLDRIIVSFFLGPSTAGIYAATTAVVSKINQFSATPLQALPVWISAASILSGRERVRQIFSHATRLNGLIAFSMSAPLMFWAQPFAKFLVGPGKSEEASQLLLHLSLIYGLYSLAGAGFYTAIGIGFPRINATAGLTSGLLVILVLTILTPTLGLMGAVGANALYILVLIINLKVKNLIELSTKEYIVHFAPAVIAMLMCWSISWSFYYSQWAGTFKTLLFVTLGTAALIFVGGRGLLREIARTPLDIVGGWKSRGAH